MTSPLDLNIKFLDGTPAGVSRVVRDAQGRLTAWVENGWVLTVSRGPDGLPQYLDAVCNAGRMRQAFNWSGGQFAGAAGDTIPTRMIGELTAPAMAMTAGQVAATQALVSGDWNREYNVLSMVSAEDGGDIIPAIRRAAVVAAASGGRVLLPPGNYTAASICNVGDLAVAHVVAHGAQIIIEAETAIFRAARPTWEAVQSISPIDGSGYWGDRLNITVEDGDAYAVGDLVKLVSDDKQRCTRATPGDGTDYRRGWMAFVFAVSGDVVTIDRPVPWSMVTNPRIGRMPRRRYSWRGGVIGYERGHDLDWRAVPFVLYGVSDLELQAEFEHTYTAAISIAGCFDATVNARGRDLRNDQANSQYGYLVNDSSYFSRVDVQAGANRHAYTTNMPLVTAGGDLSDYGPTYGALVTGQSHGNSQGGFDTHHGAERITFANVVMSGSTTGSSLTLRGIDIRAINPTIYNAKNGIAVYTEAGVSEPSDVTVEGANIDVDQYPVEYLTSSLMTLVGGAFRSRKYGNALRLIGSATLRGDIYIRPGGSADVDNKRCMLLTDCAIDAKAARVIVDMQDIPAGATEYGVVSGAGSVGSSWSGGEIRTVNDAGLKAVFYKESSATGTMTMKPQRVVTQKQGSNYLINCAITGAAGVGLSGGWQWTTEDGSGRSGYIQVTVTADYVLQLLGRGDPVITARLYAPSSLSLGQIPAGAFVGQVLMISATTAGGTLTIKHGASYNTSLPGAADIALSAEQGLTLVWNGSRWARGA